jgi:hypothetical protein
VREHVQPGALELLRIREPLEQMGLLVGHVAILWDFGALGDGYERVVVGIRDASPAGSAQDATARQSSGPSPA